MSNSSERRPESANQQLIRISFSGLSDRAVHCFVVRREVKRGAVGGEGVLGGELEVNDGKSRARRGPSNHSPLKEAIH